LASTDRVVALIAWAALALPAVARADEPGLLLVYPTHATPNRLIAAGRFIEDEGQRAPSRSSGRLRNVIEAAKALESDEIEGAVVEVTVGGRSYRAVTDDEGLWRVDTGVEQPLAVGPQTVVARAVEDKGHPAPAATGLVYVLPAAPSVAVISDYDDTVVHSGITSKREMIATALTKNSAQLRPVAGAARTYRAWREAGAAAVFYVSGSPQNFVPRVLDFLGRHRFPAGPLLLKDFGTDSTFDQVGYKLGRLRSILEAHPQTRFLLVGDSGEKDPEIYAQLRGHYPDRVVGIVIRRVHGSDLTGGRFTGMTVVDDFTDTPRLIGLLRPKPAP
jgi:phosphatidate phosphatase APP1